MRILIPILGFAAEGGYRVLSELANAWIRMGHECSFLVPATSREPYFPTAAPVIRYDRHGKLTTERSGRKIKGVDNILSLWAGLQQIGKDYDVILANHSLTAWPVRWSMAGNAKKFYYVQALEPIYFPFFKHPVKHLLARFSYLLDLRQISNSAIYQAAGLRPIDVIPPGVDLSIFVIKEHPGSFKSNDEIVLGTIGRTEPHKGTPAALAAYRLLRKQDPRLRMNVAFGNVDPSEDLTITAIKGDAALADYYRSIDILVVSGSGQYGAPHYPVIEAMASGTPVVHTDYYPGKPNNSWLARSSAPEVVAEVIREVISASQQERTAKTDAARRIVEAELGWDVVGARFAGHFND